MKGVKSVEIDYAAKTATVVVEEEGGPTPAQLIAALELANYGGSEQ